MTQQSSPEPSLSSSRNITFSCSNLKNMPFPTAWMTNLYLSPSCPELHQPGASKVLFPLLYCFISSLYLENSIVQNLWAGFPRAIMTNTCFHHVSIMFPSPKILTMTFTKETMENFADVAAKLHLYLHLPDPKQNSPWRPSPSSSRIPWAYRTIPIHTLGCCRFVSPRHAMIRITVMKYAILMANRLVFSFKSCHLYRFITANFHNYFPFPL